MWKKKPGKKKGIKRPMGFNALTGKAKAPAMQFKIGAISLDKPRPQTASAGSPSPGPPSGWVQAGNKAGGPTKEAAAATAAGGDAAGGSEVASAHVPAAVLSGPVRHLTLSALRLRLPVRVKELEEAEQVLERTGMYASELEAREEAVKQLRAEVEEIQVCACVTT